MEEIPFLGILGRGGSAVDEAQFQEALRLAAESLEATQPRISVIMPVFNREGVVTQAIDSILGQIYPPHEIVIYDDGSTDNTVTVIRDTFSKQVSTGLIRLIRGEINRGTAHARNQALVAASGDLIAYLDSDNTWRDHYLYLMAALFCQAPHLDSAYAGLYVTNRDENKQYTLAKTYDRRNILDANYIDINVFMHRASLYRELGGFDDSIDRLEDWDLIIRYTRNQYPPLLPGIGADYIIDTINLSNMTTTSSFESNERKVHKKHSGERRRLGLE